MFFYYLRKYTKAKNYVKKVLQKFWKKTTRIQYIERYTKIRSIPTVPGASKDWGNQVRSDLSVTMRIEETLLINLIARKTTFSETTISKKQGTVFGGPYLEPPSLKLCIRPRIDIRHLTQKNTSSSLCLRAIG